MSTVPRPATRIGRPLLRPPGANFEAGEVDLEEMDSGPARDAVALIRQVHLAEVRGPMLPLRRDFLRHHTAATSAPPMAAMLPRAGQDAVQLKTLLITLWMASYAPHAYQARYDAPTFARMLMLEDPDEGGGRRVADAVRRLTDKGLLKDSRTNKRGHRTHLIPLREDGTQSRYHNPAGRKYDDLKDQSPKEGWFIVVPHTFFTNGWISALPASAIVAYLMILDVQTLDRKVRIHAQKTGRDPWVFISPTLRKDPYNVSDDTFLAGLGLLQDHGLLERTDRRTHVGPSPFDFSRQEHVRLLRPKLDKSPTWNLRPTTTAKTD